MIRLATAIAVLVCLWAASTAGAATLRQVGSFGDPIYVTSDPGNPERLFVVERSGRIVESNSGATSTFADLSSLIAEGEEGGLLSIALAPDFDSSGRLYVDYTGTAAGEIHVAEMRASGTSAPLASLRDLLTIPHPETTYHYAGQLQFGPEGMLFISTGDGGGSNDEHHNAQNLESALGKLLRIDPDPSGPLPYTVPAGNPFTAATGHPDDFAPIWSYGLRNPFRFSFDRLTHAIYIGDVGQDEREEVDSAPSPGLGDGWNYGWNCREGTIEGPADDPQCPEHAGEFAEPIFDYSHTGSPAACAIIGGYVSRDPGLSSLYGRYVYGDLCTGQIRSFDPASPYASDRSEGLRVENLNSFGEDSCGRLYAVSGSGVVSRLEGSPPTSCSTPTGPRAASFVGIKAHGRRIRRHHRALLTAWVSPCNGRKGEPVRLFEGRRHVASRYLDRACTVRFRPRIRHGATFRASIAEDETYVAATSRKLKIKIDHRRKARRPGHR